MDELNKIKDLISHGEELLNTYQPPDKFYAVGRLDPKMLSRWKIQCENFLQPYITYKQAFTKAVKWDSPSDVESGLGILEGLKEDINSNQVAKETASTTSSETETNYKDDNHNPTVTINVKKLVELFNEIFSKDDLKELCRNLEVDDEKFRQDTRDIMSDEMVSYYKRRNKIHQLFVEGLLMRQDWKDEFLACLE